MLVIEDFWDVLPLVFHGDFLWWKLNVYIMRLPNLRRDIIFTIWKCAQQIEPHVCYKFGSHDNMPHKDFLKFKSVSCA